MKSKYRKIINVIHLWIGIPSALVLFVVCLSGTTYVFQKEITRWVDRDKFNIKPSGNSMPMSVAQLTSILEAEKKGLKVTGLQIPEAKTEAWIFSMSEVRPIVNIPKHEKGKKEVSGQKGKPGKKTPVRNFLMDPYTGVIRGDAQTTTSNFFNGVLQLHRWLLMDHAIGAVITGVAACCFLLLEITGLILWLPVKAKSWKKRKAWKPGFEIKYKAGWKRINHDVHKAFGFYTFLLITVLAVTGPAMGFDWYKSGLHKMLGAKPVLKGAPSPVSIHPSPGTKALETEAILEKASAAYPYAGDIRISFPKDAAGSITVAKTKNGFFASAATDRITLDQYTGNSLKLDRFSDKRPGEKIASLLKAIHTGEVFGVFSKIIYFIACLIASSLPVTGIFIWLNKRKKNKASKKRGSLYFNPDFERYSLNKQ